MIQQYKIRAYRFNLDSDPVVEVADRFSRAEIGEAGALFGKLADTLADASGDYHRLELVDRHGTTIATASLRAICENT